MVHIGVLSLSSNKDCLVYLYGAGFHPDLSRITGGRSDVRIQVSERGQKLPRGGKTRERQDNVMDIRKAKSELITSVRCRDGDPFEPCT